jgi:hypothetical protein
VPNTCFHSLLGCFTRSPKGSSPGPPAPLHPLRSPQMASSSQYRRLSYAVVVQFNTISLQYHPFQCLDNDRQSPFSRHSSSNTEPAWRNNQRRNVQNYMHIPTVSGSRGKRAIQQCPSFGWKNKQSRRRVSGRFTRQFA